MLMLCRTEGGNASIRKRRNGDKKKHLGKSREGVSGTLVSHGSGFAGEEDEGTDIHLHQAG